MQLSDQGHSETQRPCSVCRFLADSTGVMCLLPIWQLLLSFQMILFLLRCVHVYPPPALISCSNKASLILTIKKLEKILSGNKQKFLIIHQSKGIIFNNSKFVLCLFHIYSLYLCIHLNIYISVHIYSYIHTHTYILYINVCVYIEIQIYISVYVSISVPFLQIKLTFFLIFVVKYV